MSDSTQVIQTVSETNWNGLLYTLAAAVVPFIIWLLSFIKSRLKLKKEKKEERKTNEDILEEMHILINPKDKSFIETVISCEYIERLLCKLKDELGCDRVNFFLTENFELGIEPRDHEENKHDIIHIVHECRNKNIVSEKDMHETVLAGHMQPIIQAIKDNEDMLVINNFTDVKGKDYEGIFRFAGVASAVDSGVYRPAIGHRKKYMIGGIVCAHLYKDYTWDKSDLHRVKIASHILGAFVDKIYDDRERK